MSKQKKLCHRYFWTALLNIQLLLGNVYAKTFDKNIICTEVLPCATPTVASVTSSSPTCTGVQANNNGSIMLTGVANGSKYGIVAGSTYINGVTFADATAFSGSSLTINNLPNSYTNQTYTVRIFGSDGTCYVDKNATLNASVCTIPTCSTSGVSKVSDINNMLDCGNGNAPLALYLKGVGNEYHTIAPGTSPKFIEYADGTALLDFYAVEGLRGGWHFTATLTGKSNTTAKSQIFPVACTGKTATAQPDWYYYTGVGSVKIIGVDSYAGAEISFASTPHDIEVGTAAETYDARFGLGFWLNLTASKAPFDITKTYSLSTGDVLITLSNATSCCTAPTAPAINKNPTGSIGTGATLNLTATATGTGASTTYTWASSGGSFSNTSIANPTWSASSAGGYTFTVTISNGFTCTTTATSSLSISTAPIFDLMLDKSVNTTSVAIGSTATFIISVTNQGTGTATGVKVTDTFNPSTSYTIGAATASVGTFTQGTGVWNIGTIAAGTTVSLSITITVNACGVLFNTAEITAMNEIDVDSSPNNGVVGEDDIDRVCVSVPCTVCPGESYTITVPSAYTNVKWYKDDGATSIAIGNTLNITAIGSYTYTADNVNCAITGCCPFVINAGNCCAISAILSQSACNNNGTTSTNSKSDDYFNITVSARNDSTGSPTGNFEVVLNGTVIGVGQYGASVILSGMGGRFKADSTTTYTLTIRDQNTSSCSTIKTTTAVTSCSVSCPPQACPTILSVKNP